MANISEIFSPAIFSKVADAIQNKKSIESAVADGLWGKRNCFEIVVNWILKLTGNQDLDKTNAIALAESVKVAAHSVRRCTTNSGDSFLISKPIIIRDPVSNAVDIVVLKQTNHTLELLQFNPEQNKFTSIASQQGATVLVDNDPNNDPYKCSSKIIKDPSNLRLADIDLTDADFSHAEMKGWDFSNTDVRRSKFRESKLDGIDFSGASIGQVDFGHAVLRDCIFPLLEEVDQVDAWGVNLYGATMSPLPGIELESGEFIYPYSIDWATTGLSDIEIKKLKPNESLLGQVDNANNARYATDGIDDELDEPAVRMKTEQTKPNADALNQNDIAEVILNEDHPAASPVVMESELVTTTSVETSAHSPVQETTNSDSIKISDTEQEVLPPSHASNSSSNSEDGSFLSDESSAEFGEYADSLYNSDSDAYELDARGGHIQQPAVSSARVQEDNNKNEQSDVNENPSGASSSNQVDTQEKSLINNDHVTSSPETHEAQPSESAKKIEELTDTINSVSQRLEVLEDKHEAKHATLRQNVASNKENLGELETLTIEPTRLEMNMSKPTSLIRQNKAELSQLTGASANDVTSSNASAEKLAKKVGNETPTQPLVKKIAFSTKVRPGKIEETAPRKILSQTMSYALIEEVVNGELYRLDDTVDKDTRITNKVAKIILLKGAFESFLAEKKVEELIDNQCTSFSEITEQEVSSYLSELDKQESEKLKQAFDSEEVTRSCAINLKSAYDSSDKSKLGKQIEQFSTLLSQSMSSSSGRQFWESFRST